MLPGDKFLSTPELDYDRFRDVLRQDWGWHTPEATEARAFAGRLRSRNVCGFVGMDFTCNASQVKRTERDVRRDDREHYYAAIQVAGGSTVFQHDHAVKLGAGDVAIVDAAKPVTYVAQDGCRYGQWFCLQLPRRSLVAHLGFEPRYGSCGRHHTAAARLLYQLVLGAMDDEGSPSVSADTYMRLAVFDLLGALLAPSDPGPVSLHADRLFGRVCSFMKACFTDPDIGPSEVASEAGISLRYLQKLFTARGSTCGHYLQSLRLDHAACLLERRALMKTRQPLNMIAYACGFRDYTHFSRGFRRRFGYTPGSAGTCGGAYARPRVREDTHLV